MRLLEKNFLQTSFNLKKKETKRKEGEKKGLVQIGRGEKKGEGKIQKP